MLVNYRIYLNRWIGAEATYGWARNTLRSFNAANAFGVESNVHQATGALIVKLPWSAARLQPYALAGAGAPFFDPTGKVSSFVPGAAEQTKPALVYGGGADYFLTKHVSARVEYRGLVYDRPDFGVDTLHSGATAHTAEPSAGIVIRF